MSSCICKQPNGLYCRYSSVVETMTDINMTFEDYIELVRKRDKCTIEQATETVKDIFENFLEDYEEVENRISTLNETGMSRKALIEKMHKSTHIER